MVFKRYTAETKAIHPRSLSDASWERVRQLEWTAEREAELEQEFARRYDATRRSSRAGTRAGRGGSRARRSRARSGSTPRRRPRSIFSHVLWDANMFFGRDLFADQEEWFVETVRAACANDAVNWIVKLHPANVWKRRRDHVSGELDEHVADARARRRAAAAREAARSRHRHLDVVAVRRHRLRRDDPRLGRLRAAVLRQAGADRGHRLLFGPRLHRRLRDRGRVSRAAGSGPRARPAERGERRAREEARLRPLQAPADAVHELPVRLQAAWRRSTTRPRRRSS